LRFSLAGIRELDMANPRQTHTNAADSAPGVDDGRTNAAAPEVNSKPGGRSKVWLWVALSVALLVAVFIARPRETAPDPTIAMGTTQGEVAASTVPGAADRAPADPR
jgi:hypothetical protein